MLLTSDQIAELCCFTFESDMHCRSLLANGTISTENDYTSSLLALIRSRIATNSKTGLRAWLFVNSSKEERETGTDGLIVIRGKDDYKSAFFESKWPRFSKKTHRWDYLMKKRRKSHFSDQIDRQSSLGNSHVIFEMFYCEFPINMKHDVLKDGGSSCILHTDAIAHKNQRSNPNAVWRTGDALDMLRGQCLSLDAIIYDMCMCKIGYRFSSADIRRAFTEIELPKMLLLIDSDLTPDS